MKNIKLAPERDANLTAFGLQTLKDRYLLPGEGPQDLFARVASAYSDDDAHAQRIYDYISKLWFMPATPVLSNGGTTKGLPISCFLNHMGDSLKSIAATWDENIWLASRGGGIGTNVSPVRSIGEAVGQVGESSGVIPFIKVMDSLTLGISQGSQRRGSAAVYMDVHHPEIEEFTEIRKPTGDTNRRSLNIHHGVNITDEFMEAVREGTDFNLISPKTGEVRKTISARSLWQKILETRIATGEPYLLFIDTVNKAAPEAYKVNDLKVGHSNLCVEVHLAANEERTAVCCLSSVNVETFDEWRKDPMFIEDIMRFLDNVLQDFINRAEPEFKRAIYSATRSRDVGLGIMGFHSYLQNNGIPFASAMAKSLNRSIFKLLSEKSLQASVKLGAEKGPAPDTLNTSRPERFVHKMAIAPTASISIIAGGTSAGIEPIPACVFSHKTLSGTFTVRNQALERKLESLGHNTADVWASILEHQGSVQHLDFLPDYDKAVFETAFEIDQRWIVELACDRAPLIDQGQSVNLFIPADVDKWDLHMLHWRAWEGGLRSLYYLRSKSIQRASYAKLEAPAKSDEDKYEQCLACE